MILIFEGLDAVEYGAETWADVKEILSNLGD